MDEHTGRPTGKEAFLATLEQKFGRILRRQKPAPKGTPPSYVWCPRNQFETDSLEMNIRELRRILDDPIVSVKVCSGI